MGWPCMRGSLLIQSMWSVACRIRKELGSINKYVTIPTSSANRKVPNMGTVGGIGTFTTYKRWPPRSPEILEMSGLRLNKMIHV